MHIQVEVLVVSGVLTVVRRQCWENQQPPSQGVAGKGGGIPS